VNYKNTAIGYGLVSRTLHWLVLALMVLSVWLGLDFTGMERGEERTAVAALHKSLGLLLLLLMTARLAWRWSNPRPRNLEGAPRWQSLAAIVVHYSIYVLVFAQMAAGILNTLYAGRSVSFFQLFAIPAFERNHELHEFFEDMHILGWQILAMVIGLHALAAMYHHFVRKDDSLRRMLVKSDDQA
jgi:cytochrome b561